MRKGKAAAHWHCTDIHPSFACASMGGATVLKVGDNYFASEASKEFFGPPLFGRWGDKILLRYLSQPNSFV